MKITPDLFLAKLAADPKIAAEFDAIHPGMSRRDHVVRTLNLVENTIAFNKASKEKLAAARAKIVALERATASMPADLDRVQRDSLAAKKAREDAFEATRKKHAEQSARLKKTAAIAKQKAPTTARPYAQEKTDILVVSLKRKYVTGTQAELVAAELAQRGVTISKP